MKTYIDHGESILAGYMWVPKSGPTYTRIMREVREGKARIIPRVKTLAEYEMEMHQRIKEIYHTFSDGRKVRPRNIGPDKAYTTRDLIELMEDIGLENTPYRDINDKKISMSVEDLREMVKGCRLQVLKEHSEFLDRYED